MMKKYTGLFIVFLALVVFSFGSVLAVTPFGSSEVISVTNQTAPADNATGHEAIAGNVTELTIFTYTTTQSWQGYFGNITGTIQLADNDDDVMYNWSLASPEGEIYASVNDSINWTGTKCYVNATFTPALEAAYNITHDDVDGIDETFYLQDHDEFFVNNIQIAEDTCMSTRIYGDTGAGVDQEFEEVLLTGGSDEIIFTSLIEQDVDGFDGVSHDFEMLVLENGHGTDTDTSTYYFYLELE